MKLIVGQIKQQAVLLAIALLVQLGALGVSLYQPVVVQELFASVLAGALPAGALAQLGSLLGVSTALSAVGAYLSGRAGEDCVADLRRGVARRLVHLRLDVTERGGVGDLVARATADVPVARVGVVGAPLNAILGLAGLVGAVAMMAFTSVLLTTVVGLALAFVGLAIALLSRRVRTAMVVVQAGAGQLASRLDRTVSGARVMKANTAEDSEVQALDGIVRTLRSGGLAVVRAQAALSAVGSAGFAAPFLVVLVTGVVLMDAGQLTPPQLVGVLMYVFLLFGPVQQLTGAAASFGQALPAAERILELAELEGEPGAGSQCSPDGTAGDTLVFGDVTFSYPGASVPTLVGLTCEFGPRGVHAIVGPSGAGKSTLLGLATRFRDATTGHIRLGDQDVRSLTPADVRKKVGLVDQESLVLEGGVAECLRYGSPGATEGDLWAALDHVHLGATVRARPGQLDAPVGLRGLGLSGGERQRLAIARALLREPSILVLDEAGSGLDAEGERLLNLILQEQGRLRTVIVVAHRLSTAVAADRVYLLAGGRLQAAGHHDDMMRISSQYAAMVSTQRAGLFAA